MQHGTQRSNLILFLFLILSTHISSTPCLDSSYGSSQDDADTAAEHLPGNNPRVECNSEQSLGLVIMTFTEKTKFLSSEASYVCKLEFNYHCLRTTDKNVFFGVPYIDLVKSTPRIQSQRGAIPILLKTDTIPSNFILDNKSPVLDTDNTIKMFESSFFDTTSFESFERLWSCYELIGVLFGYVILSSIPSFKSYIFGYMDKKVTPQYGSFVCTKACIDDLSLNMLPFLIVANYDVPLIFNGGMPDFKQRIVRHNIISSANYDSLVAAFKIFPEYSGRSGNENVLLETRFTWKWIKEGSSRLTTFLSLIDVYPPTLFSVKLYHPSEEDSYLTYLTVVSNPAVHVFRSKDVNRVNGVFPDEMYCLLFDLIDRICDLPFLYIDLNFGNIVANVYSTRIRSTKDIRDCSSIDTKNMWMYMTGLQKRFESSQPIPNAQEKQTPNYYALMTSFGLDKDVSKEIKLQESRDTSPYIAINDRTNHRFPDILLTAERNQNPQNNLERVRKKYYALLCMTREHLLKDPNSRPLVGTKLMKTITVYLYLSWMRLVLDSVQMQPNRKHELVEDLTIYNFRDFDSNNADKFDTGFHQDSIFKRDIDSNVFNFFRITNLIDVELIADISFPISTSSISGERAIKIKNGLTSLCHSSKKKRSHEKVVCKHLNFILELANFWFSLAEVSKPTIVGQDARLKIALESAALYSTPPD